jgi:hypothetical protein
MRNTENALGFPANSEFPTLDTKVVWPKYFNHLQMVGNGEKNTFLMEFDSLCVLLDKVLKE